MDPVEYTLEGGDDSEPAEYADVADTLSIDELATLPDHEQAAVRRAFLADVRNGVKPDTAATARGIANWMADPILQHLTPVAEAQCVAEVERGVYADVTGGKQIHAPRWYWLEARGGYDRKTKEDGLPQEVHVSKQVVKGDANPSEDSP